MAKENANSGTKPPMSDAERMVAQALAEAQTSIDKLQSQAKDEGAAGAGAAHADAADGAMSPASGAASPIIALGSIDLLADVDLEVSIELGRSKMLVEDVLQLGEGSVVELDKLAGDPVDVYVNQRLIARGEVLVLNDNFCIRISEIVANLEEEAQRALDEDDKDKGSAAA